jgi:iron complex transport system substrate-binding protein
LIWRWLFLVLALAAAPAQAAPVQAAPRRIADLWYAHNATLAMLGAADRVVVTADSPAAQPWLYRLAPGLGRATVVAASPANAEALLAAGVDLAIVGRPAEADRLKGLGVPTLACQVVDLASLRDCVDRTAQALGDARARARARAYGAYLDGVTARLDRGLRGLPRPARPRVLHIGSLRPLRADGRGTLIDDWIRRAGGRNAADELQGTLQPISAEQILRWRPDVIIVGGQDERAEADPLAVEPALKGFRVVRNPSGAYQWDRHGPEFALQLLWTARLLHPDRFRDVDMAAETQGFYRRLFGYAMSPQEAASILGAAPPPARPGR